jgi:hypothetical protein
MYIEDAIPFYMTGIKDGFHLWETQPHSQLGFFSQTPMK